ncbi:serine hydrolase [Flavobacterium sp. NRK1]|uniref:serine hydrolase domain-containing protein n=1 Tax=Flavobacterium sp. NRK1 TaxID=2954929 RepID=UPI002092B4D0|nr:serine hydrolase [Flavobacterium sp. NRK1]MCO6148941.1 beta-lactamase family protein [Flavobacterium sp. NRK1]
MKAITITLLVLLYYQVSSGQTKDLVTTEGITNVVHKSNIGKVTFMNGNISLGEYTTSDFLKSFPLTPRSDLNIRVFMDNSVINYLHQLAPTLSPVELLKKGNLQFAFYVDDKFIYKENIDPGCNFGSGGNKKTSTTFRVPFTSTKGEDWWAIYLWDRFKLNGGEKALKTGTHRLRVEIRPYIKISANSDVEVGNLIANGTVELVIKKQEINTEQIKIQGIKPNSGWEISNLAFDKKKIEQLNTQIANYTLKEITSIVVIHDGKLLIEEYFNGADRNTLHDTRSAGKSFVSTLMGIAINDGYIKDENQTLNKFYNLRTFENYEVKKDSVKIRDLLTMSAAFNGSDAYSESPGNEENMYPTDNWVKFTLDLEMDKLKTNGGQWDYFTAGVVLLGDILDKKVPDGLEIYAEKKLFAPLGITKYEWQYTPQKVVNTAGSLQMTSLEYAKYAQLYKNKGTWNGRQIVPASWVRKTLTRQIQIPGRDQQFYGYLFWNRTVLYKGKNYDTFYCAGNGGNEFIIFNDFPLVIIITSKAYNRPYGHSQTDIIVKDFILPSIIN